MEYRLNCNQSGELLDSADVLSRISLSGSDNWNYPIWQYITQESQKERTRQKTGKCQSVRNSDRNSENAELGL